MAVKAKDIFKSGNMKYVYIAASIVGTIVIVRQGKKLIDKWKADRKKALLETQYTATDASGQTVVIDLGSIAAEIYDAFYNNDWFGWTEDEEAAIEALLSCPDAYIKDLGDLYYKLYGEVLKADFVRLLSETDYERVKDKFAN